jgi:VIT1/CCC1 family predicted Fe2+/Mn2+ transporter
MLEPANYSAFETLRDGRRVEIRPLRPDDRADLIAAVIDISDAHRIIAEALPPLLASALRPDQLESIRQRLLHLPKAEGPRLTKRDGLGAIGICLLSFLSTFPIVIPFILIADARLALRLSNAVAIAMLFVCGYAFGRCAGFRPWTTGLSMVAIGAALAGVAIALGG